MRHSMIPSVMLPMLASIFHIALGQSYVETCTVSLIGNYQLHGICRNSAGKEVTSNLDLNYCVVNDDNFLEMGNE